MCSFPSFRVAFKDTRLTAASQPAKPERYRLRSKLACTNWNQDARNFNEPRRYCAYRNMNARCIGIVCPSPHSDGTQTFPVMRSRVGWRNDVGTTRGWAGQGRRHDDDVGWLGNSYGSRCAMEARDRAHTLRAGGAVLRQWLSCRRSKSEFNELKKSAAPQ